MQLIFAAVTAPVFMNMFIPHPVHGVRWNVYRRIMKARLKWYRRLYWWWKVRNYEQDPDKVVTFWEWLNIHDMHLAKWELVEEYDMWGNDKHEHVLVPLDMEETEAILDRYLRNVKKVYGEPYAG